MKLRNFFVLILIVYISIVQISATNQHDEKNDDFYRQLKRSFFDKDQILSKTRSSSVIDNSPSESCSPNPCEHKGICTQKGQMTYECKCVGPWRGINCNVADACYNSPCLNGGKCLNAYDDYWCQCPDEHCEKRFYKRDVSKRQSFYELLYQFKQVMYRQDFRNDERAYYDFKNGIYF